MEHVVIIPSLDPSMRIVDLLDELRSAGFDRFIVIDDGSSNASSEVFSRLAQHGAHVVHHPENKGKGAAIKTGLRTASRYYPEAPGCVTVDGDGQHLPIDVRKVCLRALVHPNALILGTRDLHAENVPVRSRFGNWFSSLYFRIDTGMRLNDTQTGLRVIPRSLYARALKTPGQRYDFEMAFLTDVVKSNIEVYTVPITTVYDNELCDRSHFDTLRDSFLIYRTFIRFTASSLTCAAIDLGLFALLAAVLNAQAAATIAAINIGARMASGFVNFTINRRWSFRSRDGRVSRQALRYLTLFFSLMLTSSALVALLSAGPLPLVVEKMLVDSGLFFVSYFVQHNWVFDTSGQATSRVARRLRGAGQKQARQARLELTDNNFRSTTQARHERSHKTA